MPTRFLRVLARHACHGSAADRSAMVARRIGCADFGLGAALMQTSTEHVRLRVLVDNVTCSDVAIPKGDYDGYIDWEHPDDTEPRMTSVHLIPDPTISSLPCEVLQYLGRGDIERIDC